MVCLSLVLSNTELIVAVHMCVPNFLSKGLSWAKSHRLRMARTEVLKKGFWDFLSFDNSVSWGQSMLDAFRPQFYIENDFELAEHIGNKSGIPTLSHNTMTMFNLKTKKDKKTWW